MGGGGPVAELTVQVFEAKNLATKSFSGKCNSFCAVSFENQTFKTQIVKNSTSPHWNETFVFDVFHNSPDKTFLLQVLEKGALFRESPVGGVVVPLSLFQESLKVEKWCQLKNDKRKDPGSVRICATLTSNSEDEGVFSLFVKNLDLDNNWVVIDPTIDAFKIANSISGEEPLSRSQLNNSEERKPRPKEERKQEPAEDEDQYKNNNNQIGNNNNDDNSNNSNNNNVNNNSTGKIDQQSSDDSVHIPPEFLDEEQKEQERLLQEYLRSQYTCQKCGEGQDADSFLELDCFHSFCVKCIREHALEKLKDPKLTEVVCCDEKCSQMIGQWALKKALPSSDFESFLTRALQHVIDNCDDMFACPSCGVVVERVHRESKFNPNEAEGMSREAFAHKEEFRFRCRECNTEFCSSCMKIPYHSGFTCTKYEEYLTSRRCRFCKETIPASAPSSEDICKEQECQEKKKIACTKIHACGHPCGGVKGEETCLPCLHEDCVKEDQTSAEDWCSICYVEDLGSAPSIQLSSCSHILHYQCVLNKLQQKWPSPRITFGFWNCPECKEEMKHPQLEEALAPLRELYDEISKKALQRLSFEGMEKRDEIVKEDGRFYKDPTAFAMNHFAYYPCFVCKKPYFGGQVRCDAGNNDQPFKAEDLVCGGCSGVGSQQCPAHGKEFMEHKCQFCCSVASWFCWGKTHFCDACHTRQQKGDYVSKYEKDKLPKCPGKNKCPLKVQHPPNGDPFCLGCAFCRNQDF